MANTTDPRRVAEIMLSWLGLDLVSISEIQTLWAGYGHTCAVVARTSNEEIAPRLCHVCGQSGVTKDPNIFHLILKLVSPPVDLGSHDEGHIRKMLSYEVEQYFYEEIAPRLEDDVAVARCLASTRNMKSREGAEELEGLTAIVMTDLRTKFTVMGESRGVLTATQVYAALRWLARFHGGSWKYIPRGDLDKFLLPPLEEANRRRVKPQAGGEELWLNGGYTYLATRRKEYRSLLGDSESEWSRAFCSPNGGCSQSIAEKVALFLTPRGRPFETYIHGDVKSENLFTTELGDQVAFFDFQYAGLGLGVCDLAKLFTCSVPLELLVARAQFSEEELAMGQGETELLVRYHRELLRHRPANSSWTYSWDEFVRHWETALVDWCRFQASWGFWGNTEWLEARVRSILGDEGWQNWLDAEVRQLETPVR